MTHILKINNIMSYIIGLILRRIEQAQWEGTWSKKISGKVMGVLELRVGFFERACDGVSSGLQSVVSCMAVPLCSVVEWSERNGRLEQASRVSIFRTQIEPNERIQIKVSGLFTDTKTLSLFSGLRKVSGPNVQNCFPYRSHFDRSFWSNIQDANCT